MDKWTISEFQTLLRNRGLRHFSDPIGGVNANTIKALKGV